MGILERANILSKKMTFREKANMFYRLKRLLDPKEMGDLFKVIFAQKKIKNFFLVFYFFFFQKDYKNLKI